jgi:type II secretory pathway pseudopilin PulG
MDSMGLRTRAGKSGQSGFTLAGVIVIMTIMMIVVAYTVPRMWSTVLKRERERQTIYVMQQYAKAIMEFQNKNKTYPTSPQQLKDARSPRMIRGVKGEYIDPLTGEVDWLVIPQAAGASLPAHNLTPGINGTVGVQPILPSGGSAGGTGSTGGTDSSGTPGPNGTNNPNAATGLPGIPIKDYAGGPFIGVRPPTHGKSNLTLFGADTYETWVYTTLDYDQEMKLRRQAAATVYH